MGNGALKMETPFQAVLRLRGRLVLNCVLDCARSGPDTMVTPVPTYYYLRETNRSPYLPVTHATTQRVAVYTKIYITRTTCQYVGFTLLRTRRWSLIIMIEIIFEGSSTA